MKPAYLLGFRVGQLHVQGGGPRHAHGRHPVDGEARGQVGPLESVDGRAAFAGRPSGACWKARHRAGAQAPVISGAPASQAKAGTQQTGGEQCKGARFRNQVDARLSRFALPLLGCTRCRRCSNRCATERDLAYYVAAVALVVLALDEEAARKHGLKVSANERERPGIELVVVVAFSGGPLLLVAGRITTLSLLERVAPSRRRKEERIGPA